LRSSKHHSAVANRRASAPGKPIVLAGDQDEVQVAQVGGFSSPDSQPAEFDLIGSAAILIVSL
jgi:hypothetical protein